MGMTIKSQMKLINNVWATFYRFKNPVHGPAGDTLNA